MSAAAVVRQTSYRRALSRPPREGAGAVRLALHFWGRGPRRALLLHGLSSSGHTWWRIAEALAANGFSVCAPDLRGHGLSPKTGRYAVADYASDLTAAADSWDLVVGHSLGGLIAAQAAADDPAFARRLLLVDPVLALDEEQLRTLAASHLEEALRPPSARTLLEANPRWHPLDAELKAKAIRQSGPPVVHGTLEANRPWDFRDAACEIATRTLLLSADPAAKALFPPALGRELARQNPALVPGLVLGAGHSIHREHPTIVLEAIDELLADRWPSLPHHTPQATRSTA